MRLYKTLGTAAWLGLAATACVTSTNDPAPDDPTPRGGRGGADAATPDAGPGGSGGSTGNDAAAGSPGTPESGAESGPSEDGSTPDGGPEASTGDGGDVVVSGKVRIGATLFVDSDTNDTRNGLEGNDALDEAQPLANPSTTGGYIGPAAAQMFADPVDTYLVNLAQGQHIVLYIGNPSDGSSLPDFELFLYDASNDLVDSSEGTGPTEFVTAPSSGTFKVQVQAFDEDDPAEGLYTLVVGANLDATAFNVLRADKLSRLWPAVPGEAVTKLAPGSQAATVEARTGGHFVSRGNNILGIRRLALPARKRLNAAPAVHDAVSTLRAIKRLRQDGAFANVEPNYLLQADAPAPNDPLYPAQWHYKQINLTDAWDHSRGAGVIVAVIDTGAVFDHEDFAGQLVPGYDMISSESSAGDGDGIDPDAEDPGDERLFSGSTWHGTHVGGTVAAATNNSVGCAGVAPDAKVMPVRVLGKAGGTIADIAQAILYAAGEPNDSGTVPPQAADVINMSLGGPGSSALIAQAITRARDAGVIVIASAGNNATNASLQTPGGENGVVTVGAVDIDKALAPYSNFGSVVEVVAPGGDESTDSNFDGHPDGVMSLLFSNNGNTLYAPYQGTSMAAPHVAGIAALMKSAFPAMTPADFDNLLAGNYPGQTTTFTEDLGSAGKDNTFGYGLINANQAVLAALEAAEDPAPDQPALGLSTLTLDFGATDPSRSLSISNNGSGSLSITNNPVTTPSWLTVPTLAQGNNTVTVDRSGLSAGIFTADVPIESNGGNALLRVRMTVGAELAEGANVGTVYVLLVDPDTTETIEQALTSSAIDYEFSFTGVAPGTYLLAAGTDLDNNGILDDDAEAFGAYPTTSTPEHLIVDDERTGLEFAMQYLTNLQEVTGSSTGPRPKRGRFRRLW